MRDARTDRRSIRGAAGAHSWHRESAFWLPGRGGYVDSNGRGIEPTAGGECVVSRLVRNGEEAHRVDLRLVASRDAAVVDAAGAAAGLALENARLEAELRALKHAGAAATSPLALALSTGRIASR
jgi:hypothetical protein